MSETGNIGSHFLHNDRLKLQIRPPDETDAGLFSAYAGEKTPAKEWLLEEDET
ncbi:hypothetical protein [Methanoplanus endosymbiosus]|uniref:Uncharacterized protein n=1 Tax=Methanoplanus endosymbiosus TaxID=33865 RepID=A0A9E7PP78_9EURY|nr:hypothetical protein [Methanoplanus endosymbiosus]UUX92529.1 hypothetical protein L6E24_14535 [Methanoplanus endosymbiosus]